MSGTGRGLRNYTRTHTAKPCPKERRCLRSCAQLSCRSNRSEAIAAAQRRVPLNSHGPAGTEPQHQGNARTGRRGSEHGMKLIVDGHDKKEEQDALL